MRPSRTVFARKYYYFELYNVLGVGRYYIGEWSHINNIIIMLATQTWRYGFFSILYDSPPRNQFIYTRNYNNIIITRFIHIYTILW